MTRPRLMAACAASLCVSLACSDPIEPVRDGPTVPGPALTVIRTVPFHGRIRGSVEAIAPFAPGSDPACNANFTGDPEVPGPSITFEDVSEAWFSHLGKATLRAVTCVDPLSPSSAGEGVLEGANGDRLVIAFENHAVPSGVDPTVVEVSGTQWITGGSGRFAGASGVQSCDFTIRLASPTSGTIAGRCQGTLTFTPSAAAMR